MFEPCVVDGSFEICTTYPYEVRDIKHKIVVSENVNNAGYVILTLNGNLYCKHVVIAKQWIENDDPKNKIQVDHINDDKQDNRIENLQWITPSENLKKRKRFLRSELNTIKDLPEDAEQLTEYNGYELMGYYISKSLRKIISDKSGKYRILNITRGNTKRVTLRDVYGKSVNIGWQKFKHLRFD